MQQPRQVHIALDLVLELPGSGLDRHPLRLPEPVDRLLSDGVLLRHGILEAQLLQFFLDCVQTEKPRQGRKNLQSLQRYPPLLGLRHASHRAHVVQPIRQLDYDDSYFLRHCQEQKLQILSFLFVARSIDTRDPRMQGRRRFVARVTPIRRSLRSLWVVRRQLAKLRLSLHDLHHPLPKVEPNLFQTHLLPAVLHRVVKQPRHQRLCIHVQLCQDPGHLDRMRDEWLPAFSQLPRMRVKRERQGVPNERNILGGNVVEHWLQPRAPQKFLAMSIDEYVKSGESGSEYGSKSGSEYGSEYGSESGSE